MNRDLVFFILCLVFIGGLMVWFIGNIGLEDYFLFGEFKKKHHDLTPDQQEQLDELVQRIDEEIQKITDQGDDD